jgi:hypothetical protein
MMMYDVCVCHGWWRWRGKAGKWERSEKRKRKRKGKGKGTQKSEEKVHDTTNSLSNQINLAVTHGVSFWLLLIVARIIT